MCVVTDIDLISVRAGLVLRLILVVLSPGHLLGCSDGKTRKGHELTAFVLEAESCGAWVCFLLADCPLSDVLDLTILKL